jgi:hypothetical protein
MRLLSHFINIFGTLGRGPQEEQTMEDFLKTILTETRTKHEKDISAELKELAMQPEGVQTQSYLQMNACKLIVQILLSFLQPKSQLLGEH